MKLFAKRLMMVLKTVLFIACLLCSINVYALQKLTVILDWFPNPDHAPVFVALQQGFFAQHGLAVDLIGPANPSDPPKFVAAGKADIAITYQPRLLLDVAQGLPLVRVGSLIDKPLACLIANGNDVKNIKDLKCKSIAYSSAGVDSAMLNAMLQSVNLSTHDVTMVDVNYDLVQALLTHRVDALTGVQRNFELIEFNQEKFPVTVFYPEKNGIPTYDEFIFVTTQNESHDPKIKAFLEAVSEGAAYLQKHPDACFANFIKLHPELNNDLNKKAWYATLPYFSKNPFALNSTQYNQFMRFMVNQNLLNKTIPLDEYTVNLNS